MKLTRTDVEVVMHKGTTGLFSVANKLRSYRTGRKMHIFVCFRSQAWAARNRLRKAGKHSSYLAIHAAPPGSDLSAVAEQIKRVLETEPNTKPWSPLAGTKIGTLLFCAGEDYVKS